MKHIYYTIIIFILALVANCNPSLQMRSPFKTPVVIENKSKKCKLHKKINAWYAFYGIYPLNATKNKDIFESSKYSYRVTQDYTTLDKIISIGLGFMTSIIKNTVEVERCKRNTILISKKNFVNMKKESKRSQKIAFENREVLVHLKDGSSVRGRFLSEKGKKKTIVYKIKELPSLQIKTLNKNDVEGIYFNFIGSLVMLKK